MCEKYKQSDGAKYDDIAEKCEAGSMRTEKKNKIFTK
jgi:hypothetical protein